MFKNNFERLKRLEEIKDTIKPQEYREAKWVLERELCKENLGYLVTEVLDPDYYKPILAPFHYEMMSFAGLPDTRKLILVPRGHLKSSLVTVPLAIQTLLKNPESRILITNATLDNSQGFLKSVKGYLETCDKLKSLFGEFRSDKWNENEIIIKQRKKKQIKENSISCSSVDKSIVSQHFDLIIGDDLVNRETINTREQLQKTKLYYKDLLDILDPSGMLVLIGTRWHYDDLYQHILDNSKFSVFFRSCWKDGEPIFPGVFTGDYLSELRKEKGSYEFCLPKESPILLSNWKEKEIKDIKAGDELIGWVKTTTGRNKLEKSKVKTISKRILPVNTLVMKSGRKVRCTKEHRWYSGRADKTHKEYRPAKIGSKLMFVCPIETDYVGAREERLWSYLAADKMIENGCRFVREKDKVVDIIYGKEEEVYSIETETGNYVAWGYASKNSAQYLNNPVDDVSAPFKESWIKYYGFLPDNIYNYYLTLDTAGGGEGKNADSNGWVLLANDIEDNWYLELAFEDKANTTEIIDRLFALHSRYPALKIGIEKTMYVNAFRAELDREQGKRGTFLQIEELKHSTGKEARIKSLIPRFERGKVFLKKDQEALRDELLRFPKAKHDDVLDALAMASEIAVRPYEVLDERDELKRIEQNRYDRTQNEFFSTRAF